MEKKAVLWESCCSFAALSILRLYFLSAGHIIGTDDKYCIDLFLQWVSSEKDKVLEVH